MSAKKGAGKNKEFFVKKLKKMKFQSDHVFLRTVSSSSVFEEKYVMRPNQSTHAAKLNPFATQRTFSEVIWINSSF